MLYAVGFKICTIGSHTALRIQIFGSQLHNGFAVCEEKGALQIYFNTSNLFEIYCETHLVLGVTEFVMKCDFTLTINLLFFRVPF
jgi:hypothetical protein